MRVAVAIDSFKGSLSSLQAGGAIREAILGICRDAEVSVHPLADGGEGTAEALALGFDSECVEITVCGPLSAPQKAKYYILKDTKTAVIEMAAAAGITLISKEERDPLRATTYGVGEMIRDAIGRGCRRFIVGIGGSATNDGGAGMLSALGFEFLDGCGREIALGARGLRELCKISAENALPELSECSFCVACDVTNPLCGGRGCSAVYGPQKGADAQMIADMDAWLENYARLALEVSPEADKDYPGAGAAGGLGFALKSFLGADLRSGVQIVLEETGLEEIIRDADVVVTGEGRIDAQTVMGKAPAGVAALAKKYGKRVIAFCGCVGEGAEVCNEHGIDAFFPILRSVGTLEEALDPDRAYKNLFDTASQVFRLL